ncbi:MAG: DUF2157 domain-containing protein [Nanoarchaeota archaeon]|nr:DUF2157 domain-containing protein [Nanoarchaeota archaeon]
MPKKKSVKRKTKVISKNQVGLEKNKRGASFSTIISVIGAVLIGLGFAWLLALNWHDMPDILKVIILVGITATAYVIAIILREHNFPGIAKALFVLGALLYTLSVFLIAQIYGTPTGLQGIAWILLICFLGVTFSAYFFSSYTTLIIALIEFLFWISIQFLALLDKSYTSFGMIAILYLIIGIFFYSLKIWHKTFEHKFARLYSFWTIFYFLTVSYILSLQIVVQLMWAYSNDIPGNSIIFLTIFGIIAFISLVSGILISFNKNTIIRKEVLGFVIAIAILIFLISLTGISSNVTGDCNNKNCYDYKNKENCESTPADLNCVWGNEGDNRIVTIGGANEYCYEQQCGYYRNETNCNLHLNDLGCEWKAHYNRCERPSCYSNYKDKTSCESAPKGAKCSWYASDSGGKCSDAMDRRADTCSQFFNKKSECSSYNECKWNPIVNYSRGYGNIPISVWFVWILTNIFFVIFILSAIGYGSLNKEKAIINLGIGFFILDIFSRYIGFIMNLWGYTSLSVIFIIGGIILIVLGWIISWLTMKFRKKLIAEIDKK